MSGNNGHGGGRTNFAAMRRSTTVDIPEYGCVFRLRALSVSQLMQLKGDTDNIPKLLACMLIDESGNQIYSTSDSDLAELGEMSLSAMKLLVDAAGTLNGTTKEATEQALKNSVASVSTDSGSV